MVDMKKIVGKSKRPLLRPRRKGVENVRMYDKEIGLRVGTGVKKLRAGQY
jgi:hypothetical protein